MNAGIAGRKTGTQQAMWQQDAYRMIQRRAADAGRAPADFYAEMGASAGIPLGRVGRADEFADLAAYLLSARSSYVSGTGINLDGGLSPAP